MLDSKTADTLITSHPQVCARYTHGGSVKGRFEANFHSSHTEYWGPPVDKNLTVEDGEILRDSEGCGLIGLTNENLLRLTEKTDNFDLSVRFSEEGTGSERETSWGGSLEEEPFRLTVRWRVEHCTILMTSASTIIDPFPIWKPPILKP